MFEIATVVKKNSKQILNMIKGFNYVRKTEVVVGITEDSDVARENGLTNSQLLYLHENGVPSHNIPARPVLKPAIAENGTREKIQDLMKEGLKDAILRGDVERAEQCYHKAGMLGRDACKNYITSGSKLAPNAPSTIAKKGSSLPLVDTGSMLNSISYAVRKKR